MNTDAWKCEMPSCGTVRVEYSRFCPVCDGEKTIKHVPNLLLKRALTNLLHCCDEYTQRSIESNRGNVMTTGKVWVTIICIKCQKTYDFFPTEEQFKRLQTRQDLIQDILPDFSIADREMFISNICGECWADMFQEEEDEDNY